MPDRLILHDVAVACRLGVQEWERRTPQSVWIDLELAIDAARAASTDDVRQTVDYAQLVTSIKGLAQAQSYQLMETLAEAIASLVLRQSGTARVRVLVKKRALAEVGYAAVEIERTAAR